MTTVLQLADETRQKLLDAGATQDEWTFLFATVNTAVTSMVIGSDSNLRLGKGSVLELGEERCRVISYDDPSNAVTLMRGQFGTTATAHTAGDLIVVDPLFPLSQLVIDIAREIRSWPRSLFDTTTVDVTIPAGSRLVDLAVAAGVTPYRILSAVNTETGGGFSSVRQSEVGLFGVPTSIAASGWAVQMPPGLQAASNHAVRITYAHSFDLDPFTSATDLETTCRIPASMHDIIVLGAGIKAMAGKDAGRNQLEAQGAQRFPSEVPPQSWAKTSSVWQEMRRTRIAEEEARLLGMYPWRQS